MRKKPLCVGEVLGAQARPCRCLSGLVQAGLADGLWLIRQRERLTFADIAIVLLEPGLRHSPRAAQVSQATCICLPAFVGWFLSLCVLLVL